MERLFSVTKTEDRFTCVSRKDNFIMEFLRDSDSGFYVYAQDLQVTKKPGVDLPEVFDTIDKSTAEEVRKKVRRHISLVTLDSPPPISSTLLDSPKLITTPEMEIDKSPLTKRIEIVEDNTDENMPYIELVEDETDEEDTFNNTESVKKVSRKDILSKKEKMIMKTIKKDILLLRNNNDSKEKDKNNKHNNDNNNNNKNNIKKVTYKDTLSEKEKKAVEVIKLIHDSTDHPCDEYLERVVGIFMDNKTRTWPTMNITSQDIHNYIKHRGTCDGCNRARIKNVENQRRHALSNDNVNVSHQLTNIHSDLLYTIGKKPWAICVDGRTGNTFIYSLDKKNKHHMINKCINPLILTYKSRDIKIDNFFSDNEAIYKSLTNDLKSKGIAAIQCGPGEHDSISERKIRTVKSKVISIVETMGYELQPFMISYVMKWVCEGLNVFPGKTTDSPFYQLYKYNPSPDLFRFSFGDVVMCRNPYSKDISNLDRAQKGIIIGRVMNSVDSLRVLIIDKRRIVTRSANSCVLMSDDGRRELISKFQKHNLNNSNNNIIFEEEEEEEEEVDSSIIINNKEILVAGDAAVDTSSIITPNGVIIEKEVTTIPSPPIITTTTHVSTTPQSPPSSTTKTTNTTDTIFYIKEVHAVSGFGSRKKYLTEWEGYPDPTDWTLEKHWKITKYFRKKILDDLPTMKRFQKLKGIVLNFVCITSKSYPNTSSSYSLNNTNHKYCMHISSSHPASLTNPIHTGNDNMSYNTSMKYNSVMTEKGSDNEVLGILQQEVMTPIHLSTLTHEQRLKLIPSYMFYVKKVIDGEDAVKGRLVGGGDHETPDMFREEDASAGVLKNQSFKIVLGIAAYTQQPLTIFDIKQAFLWGELKDEIYMWLNPQVTKTFIKFKPEWASFVNKDGKLYVKLLKPIYGLIQAPKIFYDHLTKSLNSLGFFALNDQLDSGLFRKTREDGTEIIIGVYVDDLGFVGTHLESAWFEEEMNKIYGKFGPMKVQRGDKVKWLGIEIERDWEHSAIHISQTKFIDDSIIRKFGVQHFSSSPASPDLFKHDPQEDKKLKGDLNLKFLSAVMTASWVAKTKPEILLAVSYLSSRVTKVTPKDWLHLHRLMGYINFTKSHKLTLAPKSLNVVAWTDASYAAHPECEGQSGIVCGLGDNDESNIHSSPNVQSLFHASTNKQKFIHSSSAGSELDAQVEGIKYMVWAREVMKQLGFEQKGPSVLYQDNKSAIIMGNDGKGSFKNSKHMSVRFFFPSNILITIL